MTILEGIVSMFSRNKDPFPKSSEEDIEYKLKEYLHNYKKGKGDRVRLERSIEEYLSSLSCKNKKLFRRYNDMYSEYVEMYG